MGTVEQVIAYLNSHEETYVQRLSEWVAIKSVSASPELRKEVVRMIEHVQSELTKLGAKVELRKNTVAQELEGDRTLECPPFILAQLGSDPKKKTLCIYGHLDVQPALVSDGWDTDPFVLTVMEDGRMCGRGSTDDKGPVLGWLNVIEAYQKCGAEIPVNLKFVFEGMEESGSEGLDELIDFEKDKFLKDVDLVCISDNNWLGKNKPCITYGLRGVSYFLMSIQCASKDLHSGVYGGSVHEAMTDLMSVFSTLVDTKGNILVPGVNDTVAPLTADESALYEKIDFDTKFFQEDIGARKLMQGSKEDLLKARWRFPSLSIHGIEGAFYEPGAKTVIPRKVIGKFSVRTVPNQEPKEIEALVIDHVKKEFEKLNSPNIMDIRMEGGSGKAWVANFNDPNYTAGRQAMVNAFGMEPDLTREGGSIPVTLTFQDALNKSVILLPMGACDDNEHSQNEKLDKFNFFKGMHMFAHYFHQLGKIYN